MNALYLRRRITNAVAMLLSTLATLIGLAFLAWILWETLRQGISALDLKLFTKVTARSEEHTSELQSLMRISYAVFCLKQKPHPPTANTPSPLTAATLPL